MTDQPGVPRAAIEQELATNLTDLTDLWRKGVSAVDSIVTRGASYVSLFVGTAMLLGVNLRLFVAADSSLGPGRRPPWTSGEVLCADIAGAALIVLGAAVTVVLHLAASSERRALASANSAALGRGFEVVQQGMRQAQELAEHGVSAASAPRLPPP